MKDVEYVKRFLNRSMRAVKIAGGRKPVGFPMGKWLDGRRKTLDVEDFMEGLRIMGVCFSLTIDVETEFSAEIKGVNEDMIRRIEMHQSNLERLKECVTQLL